MLVIYRFFFLIVLVINSHLTTCIR